MSNLSKFEKNKIQHLLEVQGGGWIADLFHYMKCNYPGVGDIDSFGNDTKVRI